jgi:membrane associated rhomboid family serine protease
MLPLKDDIPTRSFPVITVTLITLNVLAFLYQLSLQGGGSWGASAAEALVAEFGLVPCRLTELCAAPAGDPGAVLTMFTSMFLHGGLFHISANMLYLWIFGDNVEDTLGHTRFALFYVVCGIIAALAQTLSHPASRVPMIGASGAVSGVLGAYLVLFPRARVLTLLILGFFVRLIHVPALIVLSFWIVVQMFQGYLAMTVGPAGGVAWFAHVGGFMGGLVLLVALRARAAPR